MEKVLAILHEMAARKTVCEDGYNNSNWFIPAEASGFNYDDCYDMGQKDGEILFARTLLQLLEKT